MIVAKLMGGLGNQMFQYAAALSLANRYHAQAKVDLSFINADPKGQYTKRHFELDIFEPEVPVVTDLELAGLEAPKKNPWLRLFSANKTKLILEVETHPGFNENFRNFKDNTYLQGFWQSEKYFEGSENLIRQSFVFSQQVKDVAGSWIGRIGSVNSVSLHIRRGDYAARPDALQYHGLLPMHYYERALEQIRNTQKDIEIFVFSDDLSWCKSQFSFTEPTHFVDASSSAAEMYLMTCCKHQVIANSSFSWWGAWLNANPNKVVLAPKQWNTTENTFSKDIYCKGWIVL